MNDKTLWGVITFVFVAGSGAHAAGQDTDTAMARLRAEGAKIEIKAEPVAPPSMEDEQQRIFRRTGISVESATKTPSAALSVPAPLPPPAQSAWDGYAGKALSALFSSLGMVAIFAVIRWYKRKG